MSTNKTQNYELHSWLPQDEFHVTEINENFAALDSELSRVDMGAARVLTGTFVGNAMAGLQPIELGIHPQAVLVFAELGATIGNTRAACLVVRSLSITDTLMITETGFQYGTGKNGGINLNVAGQSYIYMVLY